MNPGWPTEHQSDPNTAGVLSTLPSNYTLKDIPTIYYIALMIKSILFILIIVIASCKTVSISKNMQGKYYKLGKDYVYDLSINNDGSFILTQKYFEVNSTCQGKWQRISKDTILLKFDSSTLSEKLLSGYMTEREKKVIVLKKDKLKFDEVILKRKLREF